MTESIDKNSNSEAGHGRVTRSPGQAIKPEHIRRWGPVWSRRVGWFLAHVVWNTKIIGKDNLPKSGRVIVAGNHSGVIDGPLLHGCLPRGSHFIIKEEAFFGVIGVLMRGAGQIPVDRKNGRAALSTALAMLQEDRVVGIFPEGQRGRGDVKETKAGIAWLAVRADAPVVPVAILGTRVAGKGRGYVPGFRKKLHVVIGEPITVNDPDLRGREAVNAAMGVLQQALAAHVSDSITRTGVPLPTDQEVNRAGETTES